MPSLLEFLDSASPGDLASAHSLHLGRAGLVQRSRIRSELESWILDSARLDAFFANPELKTLTEAIYLAGERGLTEAEVATLCPENSDDRLHQVQAAFLGVLVDDRPQRLVGFHEHADRILGGWLSRQELSEPVGAGKLPASRAFLEGIAGLSAWIDLGRARLNRSGDLNRRDRQGLRERFFHLQEWGEPAQELALDLALAYLQERSLLQVRKGKLECVASVAGLLEDPVNLWASIRRWWLDLRLGQDRLWLYLMDACSEQALSGRAIAEAFARREGRLPVSPELPLDWTRLTPWLREALALGFLNAEVRDGSLERVQLSVPALAPIDRPLASTADFQVFLGPGATLLQRRSLEFVAVREVGDLVSRYRLQKEAFLSGVAQSVCAQSLDGFLEELAAPANVAAQLREWLDSRRTCQFHDIRVLRVNDARRQAELAALPMIRELVQEEIPGWGFVVEATREVQLRKVLAQLGFDPPAEDTTDAEVGGEFRSQLAPPQPLDRGDWLWPASEAPAPRQSVGATSRYGGELRELDFSDLLRLVEYAVLIEAEMELVLKTNASRTLKVRPLRLERRKEPIFMQVRIGHESRDIPLETVRKARVLEINAR